MKILLRTPVNTFTGYGNDGISLSNALMERGHDVRILPQGDVIPPLPMSIAGTLTKPAHGEQFDVSITHAPPTRVKPGGTRGNTHIFWSMWEWENLPNGQSLDLSEYDHVVAYDVNSKKVFQSLTDKTVEIVQGGVETEDWDFNNVTLPDTPLTFGMVGARGLRKNPWSVLKAFRELTNEVEGFDARLVLKTSYPVLSLPGKEMNFSNVVEILDPWYPPEKLYALYSSIDVLVAPSWGEGKNLPALEAALTGCDLMLSDCSGHNQWADWSMITKLKGVDKDYDITQGLVGRYVSSDTIKAEMLRMWQNSAQYKRRNQALSQFVRSSMSWDKVVDRLAFKLKLPL